jgi:hypothetical protein
VHIYWLPVWFVLNSNFSRISPILWRNHIIYIEINFRLYIEGGGGTEMIGLWEIKWEFEIVVVHEQNAITLLGLYNFEQLISLSTCLLTYVVDYFAFQ